MKKNITYIKAILDIVQRKKNHYSVSWEEKKNPEDLKIPKDDSEKKAQQEILKKYGAWRLKNDNPYELVDAYNVEMNLPEIGKIIFGD